jgi:hypothetical protein
VSFGQTAAVVTRFSRQQWRVKIAIHRGNCDVFATAEVYSVWVLTFLNNANPWISRLLADKVVDGSWRGLSQRVQKMAARK